MKHYPLSVIIALALPSWLERVAVWLIDRATDRIVAAQRPRHRTAGVFGTFSSIVDSYVGANHAKKAMQSACAEQQARAAEAHRLAVAGADLEGNQWSGRIVYRGSEDVVIRRSDDEVEAQRLALNAKVASDPARYHHVTGNARW